MPVPLQRLNKGGQERDQLFGTDLIGCGPYLVEGLLDNVMAISLDPP